MTSPGFRTVLFRVLLVCLLAPSAALAAEEEFPPGEEPCHLLCVTESGRTEGLALESSRPQRVWLRVQTAYLDPLGAYTVGRYEPRPAGSRAWAVQVLPSLAWSPRPDVAFVLGFPWEYNRAHGTVLPTLLPSKEGQVELAPGRLSVSAHKRVATDWPSTLWVGAGYALSDPIGTVAVRDSVETVPETAIEALGVGTDDVWLSARIYPEMPAGWVVMLGAEGRVNMLPRYQRVYGTTGSYAAWVGRELGPVWTVGVRAAGYRTLVQAADLQQVAFMTITPTVTRDIGSNVRLSAGILGSVPGSSLNENTLQTVGGHFTFETGF